MGRLIDRRRLKRDAFIFITVTSSAKLTRFRRKYQKSLKKVAEYPVHQVIHLGRLEIHIAFSNLRRHPCQNPREGCCVVIVSVFLPEA